MSKIEKLNSITADMKMFDKFAKDDDYITVTQWGNGEGWDISLSGTKICITEGELRAINFMTCAVDNEISIYDE